MVHAHLILYYVMGFSFYAMNNFTFIAENRSSNIGNEVGAILGTCAILRGPDLWIGYVELRNNPQLARIQDNNIVNVAAVPQKKVNFFNKKKCHSNQFGSSNYSCNMKKEQRRIYQPKKR